MERINDIGTALSTMGYEEITMGRTRVFKCKHVTDFFLFVKSKDVVLFGKDVSTAQKLSKRKIENIIVGANNKQI